MKAQKSYYDLIQNTTEVQKCQDQIDECIKHAFCGKKIEDDYGWTNHKNGFKGIEKFVRKEVERLENKDASSSAFFADMHLGYKRACLSIHSNSMGNDARLGSKPCWNIIDTTAHVTGHGFPLWFAFTSFHFITGISAMYIGLDYTEYDDRLHCLIHDYRMRINE